MDIHFVGLKKIFCLEDVGILHSARMKICILSTFPTYGKVGVNQKNFWLACLAGVKGGRVGEGLGGGMKEREEGNAWYKNRVFCISPLYIQISQLSLQRPDALEHEKMFATECRRRDSHKNL